VDRFLVLNGGVVLLSASGGCKDEHVDMYRRSHQKQKGALSSMVLQFVVESGDNNGSNDCGLEVAEGGFNLEEP
jgi:hypothetical protein